MEKKHVIGALVLLVLFAGVGWALFAGEDAELAEMKQMRDDMFNNMDKMSDEERRATRDAFRQRADSLSEDQRRELGRGFRQFMMQRVDQLLAMPRDEQVKELDKWIDRMEERRQNREANGGEGRGDRGGRGGRGGNMTPEQRDQRRKQGLDRTSPEMRGKMDQMKDLINERREERGLEPIQGGRPPFGPPRGGPR